MPLYAETELRNFLGNNLFGNLWLYPPGLEVYVRKSWRFFSGGDSVLPCFDIASVSADIRGAGTFTLFLETVESMLPVHIYIESVLKERFENFFLRHGYIREEQLPGFAYWPSFFKTPRTAALLRLEDLKGWPRQTGHRYANPAYPVTRSL